MNHIPTIRKQLRAAATHEPAEMQPFISVLDRQLRSFGNENEDGKAALRPEIEKNIKRIEAAR